MDVAPTQIVSVAASLVPFLEHDDANRALMGANMQRQAVPCLRPEKALVGTGVERVAAVDSGTVVAATRGGVVDYVDTNRIVIRVNDDGNGGGRSRRRHLQPDQVPAFEPEHEHPPASDRQARRQGRRRATSSPTAHRPTSASSRSARTCWSRSCPGTATTSKTRSCISERVIAEDRYTSIHIEELVVMARDTKLGAEEITRDIPNLAEKQLAVSTSRASSTSAPK